MKRISVVLICLHLCVYAASDDDKDDDKKAATEHLAKLLANFNSRETKGSAGQMLQDIADAIVYGATFEDAQVDLSVQNTHDKNRTLFDYAIKHEHWNLALLVLQTNSSIELKKDKYGRHLLHILTLHDQAMLIEALLNLDINPDPVDEKVETPLHYAARRGNAEIAKLLLQHHANKLAHNLEDKTPRMVAMDARHYGDKRYSDVLSAIDSIH